MADAKFTIGDTVWSKMKGYCPWPSRIAEASESSLKPPNNQKGAKPQHLVYFFGSNNFAWLSEDHVKPYDDFKDKNKNGSKSVQFKEGLKQIEEYIKTGRKTNAPSTTASAINNVTSTALSSVGDSVNDFDDLPSIDEEIALINNKKPTQSPPVKKSYNILNNSPSKSTVSSSVKDYGKTPNKTRKGTKPDDANDSLGSPTKKTKTEDDSLASTTLSIPKSPLPSSVATRPAASKSGARNILLRASQFTEGPTIEAPKINMSSISAKAKNIKASNLKFGFVGLGLMGQRLLKNLLNSGHKVTIWNRTPTKCKEFIDAGAERAETPGDVVIEADVTFSCLSDPKASKEIVFGPFGILAEMNASKGFVEMSSIDPETSNDISEAIMSKGGRYLEAPMIGNGKEAAEEGELTIVAAGDKTLYEECSSCFQAMSKQTFFLGHQVGTATKMNLILSTLYGTMVGSLIECCTLVERCDLQLKEFKEILKLSPMNCPLLDSKVDQVMTNDYSVHMPLGHLQKDLRLSLNLAEEYDQAVPITAATNEVYKVAKRSGYADSDAAAVYLRSRF